jgi:hypothetical protein
MIVISPVIARSLRTGTPFKAETMPVTMVTPAEGPSFGGLPCHYPPFWHPVNSQLLGARGLFVDKAGKCDRPGINVSKVRRTRDKVRIASKTPARWL